MADTLSHSCPVKYGKALLDEEVINITRETAIGIEDRYEIEIEAMGMDRDYIHLLCGGHPKVSVSRIVQVFKSITAREIFWRKPIVKKELWQESFGQIDIMCRLLVRGLIGRLWFFIIRLLMVSDK